MADVNTLIDSTASSELADAESWLTIFSVFIHDLESPFATVKYLLKLLDEGKYDSSREGHRRVVASSRIAVERAESIIYDILAVAKAGKAGLPVSMTAVEPGEAVQNAVTLAEGAAAAQGVSIAYTPTETRSPVQADPGLLQRMLDNLLFNALRHTPSGGVITVTTEAGQESLFIHIKDSGPGLGDIEGNILFERFGQVQLRAEGKHRGVGLGLYFCRLAAEGMGGTIVADDHPDGGAVFTLKLRNAAGVVR